MKKIVKIFRDLLESHSIYFFEKIQWKIIEGNGSFNYAQYFPEIKRKPEREFFNTLTFRFFRKKLCHKNS